MCKLSYVGWDSYRKRLRDSLDNLCRQSDAVAQEQNHIGQSMSQLRIYTIYLGRARVSVSLSTEFTTVEGPLS